MSDTVSMDPREIKKCLAIVMFGPATPTSGTRPAEYYTVTIDPTKRSPSGEYIRFGLHKGDEINGWQRVAALTVVEILAEFDGEVPETIPENTSPLEMMVISA
jgi:hypothetical protein